MWGEGGHEVGRKGKRRIFSPKIIFFLPIFEKEKEIQIFDEKILASQFQRAKWPISDSFFFTKMAKAEKIIKKAELFEPQV